MDISDISNKLQIICQDNGPLSLTILIFCSIVLGLVMQKAKLPEITGYILAGILLGTSGIGLFSEHFIESLQPVNHIALGMMALTIGTHLNFHKLQNSGRRVMFCSIGETFLSFSIVLITFLFLFDQNLVFALLVSAIAISTAPATTVSVVKEAKAKGTLINTLMPMVAINNTVTIILFGVFMNLSEMSVGANTTIGIYQVFSESFFDLCLSLFIGLSAGFLLKLYTEKRRKIDNELMTIILLLVMATTGFSKIFLLNPMLPCLVIGIFISNTTNQQKRIIDAQEMIEHLIVIVFFAMAGMHLDITHIGKAGMLGAGYFLARGLGKILGGSLGARFSESPDRVTKHIGLTLLPQSGVAIGLIILASQVSSLSNEIDLLITIVLASVTLNEIIGAPLTKWALFKSGEANQATPKLIEFLGEEYINANIKATEKTEAISEMVRFLVNSHDIAKEKYKELLETVLKREEQMSTGIGDGIAVPHGIIDITGSPYIWGSIGLAKNGIQYNAIDGKPVYLIVLVITPKKHRERHLKVLTGISKMLNKKATRDALFQAKSAAELYEILKDLEMQDFNYFID